MSLKHIAAASVAAFTLASGAASAATLSIVPGVSVSFGTGNYDAFCDGGLKSMCYNPGGSAALLTENLQTYDAASPGPGLVLDQAARIRVTFLGKEAGAQNYAFSLGGTVSNKDAVGSFYSTVVAGGTLDFSFSSSLGTLAANDGTFIGTAAMGFSQLYNGGKTVYAFFDDSGSADDRDYDDMVVRIDVAPVPVPAAGFLLIAGLGGLAALKRRKKA